MAVGIGQGTCASVLSQLRTAARLGETGEMGFGRPGRRGIGWMVVLVAIGLIENTRADELFCDCNSGTLSGITSFCGYLCVFWCHMRKSLCVH